MCKEIAIFENGSFGKVRVVMRGSEPWFVASDIAKSLGYADPNGAISKHCNYAESLTSAKMAEGHDLPANTLIIPEPDVYALIFRSKLSAAEAFRKWVCEEVLPAIRKTGKYELAEKPQSYSDALRAWADEIDRRELVEKQKNELIEARWQERTKVAFANKVSKSYGLMSVGELAKLLRQNIPDLQIGRNRLYNWFRENGWMLKTGKHKFEPSQKAIEHGYMKITIKVEPVGIRGKSYIQSSVWITPKGIEYFCEQFQKDLLI